jgi:phosphoribosylaminoimidazolecarboxamide formyltransferase / IMP cyclohydrolase
VRAAAKNHAHVGVVTSPEDYAALLSALRDHGGIPAGMRRALAARAFAHTAAYDAAVAGWFHRDETFPPMRLQAFTKAQDLRYGENPHQSAAYYRETPLWGLGSALQLHGKELSYNNLLDTDAAWGMVADFDDAVAKQIIEVFTEVVVAPAFTDEALDVLQTKANLRILAIDRPDAPRAPLSVRSVAGGLLVQDADVAAERHDEWTIATATQPDDATMAELRFAWQACKHVKSNAIVLTRDRAVVGVGAGQMSRVDSVRLAVEKSEGRCDGAVLASDAFFPFRDGPDAALAAGIRAIVQPGGSVRDEEVVAACDERGIPMILTGRRHFRH